MARLNLMTWNIQWGRGCDGNVDLRRIVDTARATADFDVLCLQEVARNFPDLPGSLGEDQFRLLAELLPGYAAVEGIGTDVLAANGAPAPPSDGARRQFGNMILTRLPVLQAFRHLLPWPADPEVPSMQRVAVEAVLQAPWGPLRVTTTHLEYYSARQRAAQVERLRELQAEAAAHAHDISHARKEGGPFENAARPASGILTADFNFRANDPLYARLQAPFADAPASSEQGPAERGAGTRLRDATAEPAVSASVIPAPCASPGSDPKGSPLPPSDGAPYYVDSWEIMYPGAPHAPTLGVFDREQWPEPQACDFIFVTGDLAHRVREVRVNSDTDASDHQPVLLSLNGN